MIGGAAPPAGKDYIMAKLKLDIEFDDDALEDDEYDLDKIYDHMDQVFADHKLDSNMRTGHFECEYTEDNEAAFYKTLLQLEFMEIIDRYCTVWTIDDPDDGHRDVLATRARYKNR